MVPQMIQSEESWKHIESFITEMMRTEILIGVRISSDGEGQYENHPLRSALLALTPQGGVGGGGGG